MFVIYGRPGLRRKDLVCSTALRQVWSVNLHLAKIFKAQKSTSATRPCSSTTRRSCGWDQHWHLKLRSRRNLCSQQAMQKSTMHGTRLSRRDLRLQCCTTSLRGELGQAQKLPLHAGSEASRQVELRQQPEAARNGQPAVRNSFRSTFVSGPWQHQLYCAKWSLEDVASSVKKPFLELFAGCTICKSVTAEAWDIEYCSSCNLLCPDTLQSLIKRIKLHCFSLVQLGVPCTTWSRARKEDGKGHGPLRSDANLWDLPGRSHRDKQKIAEGNNLLYASLAIIEACMASNTPWMMDNPASSRMWLTQQIAQLLSRGAKLQLVHYCMYGQPWRKAMHFLTRRCSSSNNVLGASHAVLAQASRMCPLLGRLRPATGARVWLPTLPPFASTLPLPSRTASRPSDVGTQG